jgi:hypothetical protein
MITEIFHQPYNAKPAELAWQSGVSLPAHAALDH